MKILKRQNLCNSNKLKTGICALALAAVIGSTTISTQSYASNQKVDDKVKVQVEQDSQKQAAKKREQIASEALSALQETSNALKALDEGKTKDALASLEKATGKLEIILARDPQLAFAPVSVTSRSQDIITSTEHAKQMVKEARKLLDDGKVQDARALLSTLASETVITVSSLPMATYPDALKEAAALIDEGKIEKAKTVLQVALNTLAIDVTIIPIPVANAKAILAQAETLAEKPERTEDEDKRLSNLLNAAEEEIKFAQVLGYGEKKDFDNFYEEIKVIREKTSDGKSGAGFFRKISGYIASITKNSQPESRNN